MKMQNYEKTKNKMKNITIFFKYANKIKVQKIMKILKLKFKNIKI